MLSVRDLRAGYGAIAVLHGISFDVSRGETVALLGPNGAGKTTTLKAVVGALRPSGGTVTFEGQNLTGCSADRSARLGISMVPEGRGIFDDLTVRENLEMGCWTVDDASVAAERIGEVTEIFPVLHQRMAQRAGTLSGGEQQMLAIARALVAGPKLLLIDEMSQGLAPIVVKQLFQALRAVRERGTTILLVEQQVGDALAIADRVYILENGEIAASGSSAEMAGSVAVLEASYLGGDAEEAGPAAPAPAEEGPATLEKILVPLTAKEKRTLQSQAETAGVSVGDLLAQALRDWRPKRGRPAVPSRVAALLTPRVEVEPRRRSLGVRIVAGAASLALLAVVAFQGYGWWTRRNPPEFGIGGSFGVLPTQPSVVTPTGGVPVSPGAAATNGARPAASGSPGAPGVGPAVDASVMQLPAIGRWAYKVTGPPETAQIGPFKCTFPFNNPMPVTVAPRDAQHPRDRIIDWLKSGTDPEKPDRAERHVYSYRPDGVYLEFASAAVVCQGVQQNPQNEYRPPMLRLKASLKVGDSWRTVSQAIDASNGEVDRTDTVTVTVKRFETITVPAGTFKAYVVEYRGKMEGSQTGTTTNVRWVVPSLGLWVKEISDTTAKDSSGATFESHYTMELSQRPA